MYCKFFGFSKIPFNLTPDPDFLFMTRNLQEAAASLIYGINQRKGFISISGEVGTGKTTLLTYVGSVLDPKIKTVFFCQTTIAFEEMLREILTELNLPSDNGSKSYMTRQLRAYLKETLDQGENVAILIDEAQNLSKEALEELRMLSNLETGEAKLLQLVLVGQPELENKLNSPDLRQLRQRIGIHRKIQPLTEEESRQYIEHRLNRVGSSGTSVFTPEALSLICKHSEGIFRKINILCDNALLIGYGLQQKIIDADIVREVLSDLEISVPEEPVPSKIVNRPEPILKKSYESSLLSGEVKMIPARRGLFRRVLYLLLGIVGLAVIFFIGIKLQAPSAPRPNPAFLPPKAAAEAGGSPKEIVEEVRGDAKAEVQPFDPSPGPKKIVEVVRGDTLSSISQKYYKQTNRTLIDHILRFNPEIDNINLIKVEQRIIIPEIKEESFLIESSDGGYEVHLGTFDNPKVAQHYKNESVLRGKNIEAIPRKVSPEETWYRLVVGKFQTRNEALKTLQVLREKPLLLGFK